MEYINDFKKKFEALGDLKKKYELDTKDIDEILESIEEYRITTPVIGNFSTGKSSIINAIVGKNILGVEITPETAVPTEVYYGEGKIVEYTKEGLREHSFDELPLRNLSIETTELIQIQYDNAFLKEIENVSLVDLPGFDTNIELHNRAIDQYLPKSLAYLLVVSADEPVLKESMTNFLRELKVHNMPIYVIITKCNRLLDSEVEACKELVSRLVKDLMEREDIQVACADSYGNVKVEEVKDFLREINGKTKELFIHKYKTLLDKTIKSLEFYFAECIDKKDLSTSELEYEQEKLQKKIDTLFVKLEKEKADFNHQMEDCIGFVQERVRADLRATADEIAVLLENGVDITDKINLTIRGAVMLSIKTELEPSLQKYVSNVTEVINVEFPNKIKTMENMKQLSTKAKPIDLGTRVSPAILAALGLVLVNPIIGIVGALAGGAANAIFNSAWDRKKERAAKKTAEKIIAEIEGVAADNISREIKTYISNVNRAIEKDVLKQKEVIEKSIQRLKEQLETEEGFKENELERLRRDLQRMKSLQDF